MFLTVLIFIVLYGWLIITISKLLYRQKYGVQFICAEIGAGKSCYAVKMAKKYLRKGWRVVSNERIKNVEYVPDIISVISDKRFSDNTLVIIDEASLVMNSRKFKDMTIRLIEYFKLCRHFKNRVILISQTFNDTDKQIRELAHDIKIIKQVIPTKISMPCNVKSRLGVNQLTGEIQMQYKVGKLGLPFFLPFHYRDFNSFSDSSERECV